jgi:hypothetical protein
MDPLGWLVSTFGVFLLPAALFALGLVGYWLLVTARRRGLLNGPN